MRNPVDIYIFLPIVLKIILTIVLPQIGIQMFLIQNGIILLSILVATMYRSIRNKECDEKKLETSFFGRLIKSSVNSLLFYAIGIIATFVVIFIPYVPTILKALSVIPFGPAIIEGVVWGLGLVISYILINLSDDNIQKAEDLCKGTVSGTRSIISIIIFLIAAIYQFYTQ